MDNDSTIMYKGYTIRIIQDDNPDNPRDWDNMGEMVFFHRRMNLGDKHHLSVEELNDDLATGDYVYLLVQAYEHSSITITANPVRSACYPFNDIWDSGTLGVIRVSKANIRDNYNCKRISKRILQRVYSCLRAEVETYDDYLTGNVWGYEVIDPDGNDIDSCWGYYGYDMGANGLLDAAQNAINCAIEEAEEKAQEHATQLELVGFFE